jgi:hypothetical protein
MEKATPAQAEQYLREVGQWYVPEMSDDNWVKVVGFLLSSGFIADADYSTDVGQILLTIVGDVFDEYQAWKDNFDAEILDDVEP